MKKINIKLFSALLLSTLFVSCDNNDDATGDSTLVVAEGVVGTIALASPLTASQTVREADENSYDFTITLNKVQVKDIHVSVVQIDGTADEDDIEFSHDILIPAGSLTGSGSITVHNDDVDEDDETVTLKIGNANTSNATVASSTVTFVINDCFSDLAGTYDYVTTNVGEPGGNTVAGPLTGSVTFTAASAGLYNISDASFGGWIGLYGAGNIATGVKLKDLCGQMSYDGVDQFNEVFTFSNLQILGSTMSFHWQNDYGEYGDTTLTRTDGTDWPLLFL